MSPGEQAATSDTALSLYDLLVFVASMQASDLHLKPMRPPLIRLNGKLVPVKADPLRPAELDLRFRDQVIARLQ